MRAARFVVLALVAVVIGLAVGAGGMVERAAKRVQARVETALDVSIAIDTATWTYGGSVAMTGITVRAKGAAADAPPLVQMDNLAVESDIRVWARQVKLRTIRASGVHAHLARGDSGGWNIDTALAGVRTLFSGGGTTVSAGGEASGLRHYLVSALPELNVDDLAVTVDTGTGLIPDAIGAPRRLVFSSGTLRAKNPALLKEDDAIDLTLAFADCSLDPGHGLELKAHWPLRSGVPTAGLKFDRPARVTLRDRVAAISGVRWDGANIDFLGLALSVPRSGGKGEAPVAPAVTIRALRLTPPPSGPTGIEWLASLRSIAATGDGRALIEAVGRFEVTAPTIAFERRSDGHSFDDLLPKRLKKRGPAKAPPAPEKSLGPLVKAALSAAQRLSYGPVSKDGSGIRGFLVRGFSRLERGVTALSGGALTLARSVPFQEVVIKGGHFDWRDGLDGGRSVAHRFEYFDLTVRHEADRLTFDASFQLPGGARARNSVQGVASLATGDVQITASLASLPLYPYRHVFPVSTPVSETTALRDTKVTLVWSPSSNMARLEGTLGLVDAAFHFRPLASEPLRNLTGEAAFSLQIDMERKTVVLGETRVKVGEVRSTIRADVARYDTAPKLTGVVEIQRGRCQDLVDAIPHQLIPMLEGLRVKGTFGWNLDMSLDTANMDSLVYHSYPELHAFEVVSMGARLDLDAVRGTFLHRIREADGTVREMLVGPGAPGWSGLSSVSPYMVKGVTTTEDGSFFRHQGFSTYAIRDSLVTNLKKGTFARGASTISQQVVKNLFLSREKTISRKLQELFITWQLERALSKDRIMSLYLNIIEWGPGIYGVRKAARYYFDKLPSELAIDEAVFLVSLIPSPRRYHHQFARGSVTDGWRRHLRWIAKIMMERGKISAAEFQAGLPYSPLFRGQERPEEPEVRVVPLSPETPDVAPEEGPSPVPPLQPTPKMMPPIP